MTDLHALLPNFAAAAPHAANLLAGLETHRVSLSELLTLDAAEIGKRTRLPLIDLQRFTEEVRAALAAEAMRPAPLTANAEASRSSGGSSSSSNSNSRKTPCITTLDPIIDEALGGGFPAGCVSEIVGESGVGKTQLLLALLLAVQLPPEYGGLGRRALYISSEAPLATGRLTQMLRSTGTLRGGGGAGAEGGDGGGIGSAMRTHCSLQGIATINIPDLEAQEHILTHQLPVQLAKAERAAGPGGHGAFGLVVIDSVAANFRPFFGGARDDAGAPRAGAPSLAARSLELARLGMLLRNLAHKHNLAVVVANQVADRFEDETTAGEGDGISLLSQQQPPIVQSSSVLRRRPPEPTHQPPPLAKRPRHAPPDSNSASTGTAAADSASLQMPPPQHPHRISLTQESPLAARSRRQPEQPIPPLLAAALASSQTDSPLPTSTPPLPSLPTEAHAKPQPPPSFPENDDLPTTQYIPPSLASQQFGPPTPLPVLKLDHQQRWFTGWGDNLRDNDSSPWVSRNKTPALGLVWATQLAMRVALLKTPRVGRARQGNQNMRYGDEDDDDEPAPAGGPRLRHSWRRWIKVVFAPHVAATATPVEFEIAMGGLRAVVEKTAK